MYGLTDHEWQQLSASVNTQAAKRELSPAAVSRLANQAAKSTSVEELAQALGFKGTTMLRKLMLFDALPDDIREKITWGTKPGSVSMSTAAELIRIKDADAFRHAFEAATTHGFKRTAALRLVQLFSKGAGDIKTCVQQVI
jgi:hypothetical protein